MATPDPALTRQGNPSLPIWHLEPEILHELGKGGKIVLAAPTGSGKSTQVPQMILDSGLAGKGRIVVLEPRRVAARTLAMRVSWERGVPLGSEVGYQVRFEDHINPETRICFVTEGILLRWMQDDPNLSEVSAILFDEFHERNLLSDLALGLVKRLQEGRRPELKVAVMSATLEIEKVAAYLDDCPALTSEGTLFPVEIEYLDHKDERPAPDQAADAVERYIRSGGEGDLLVFMPGMGEIMSTINAIRVARVDEALNLIPLHGDLSPDEQDRAFQPSSGRKIVVATNVAETSVTIDGIRCVIDSGLARVARFDAERGIGTLHLEEISRASSDQRKGRAGRTGPGRCLRLWTESGHLNRPERNTPEIQRADLAEVVLTLHSMGVKDAARFDWIDKPDVEAVARAERLLRNLGALRASADGGDERSDLTPVGRQMLRLPMHPRFSRMMVEATRRNSVSAAALCAALVSGRDLLMRAGRDDKMISEAREVFEGSAISDFYTLIRAFQHAKNSHFSVEACRRYGIHALTARQVNDTFEQILEIATRFTAKEVSAAGKPAEDQLPQCILAGFADQLCLRRDQGTLECDMTEGRHGTMVRETVVTESPLFVTASIREITGRNGHMTLLALNTAVKREWLDEMFPQHISQRVEHRYDRLHKRVAAIRFTRFLDLTILAETAPEIVPKLSGLCLADAVTREFFELPNLSHEVKQFIGRANFVAARMPDLEFPRIAGETFREVLAVAFSGLTLAKEAQAADLLPAFKARLGPERCTWLDELAPVWVPFGEGKKVKLTYDDDFQKGPAQLKAPEAQVKLVDCFAVSTHPKICESREPVRLWLCAPDGKRLADTLDWPAFRAMEYPKLKAGPLKKYPGVAWL